MGFLLPIAGAVFFGPWGALIGGFLQQIFFPPEGPKGPRLNELNVQHSTVGAPVPIVYGTAALAGNVIWSGGLLETKHEDEQGGFLGIGGVTTTSYTYSVDVAIGICEGPISGIRRIWADADLIFDASDDATLTERLDLTEILTNIAEVIAGIRAMSAQLNFELYLGTEDQLPDPTIESYEPAGTVPGFRGLAYIVFNDFQLEKWGNRIPNFRFEIYSGTPTECGLYSAGTLVPWEYTVDSGVRDPRSLGNNYKYGFIVGGGDVDTTLDAALADMQAEYDRPFLISEQPGTGLSEFVHGWAGATTTPNEIAPEEVTGDANVALDYVRCTMLVNSLEIIERYFTGGHGVPTCDQLEGFLGHQHVGHITSGPSSGFWVYTLDGDTTSAIEYFGYPSDAGGSGCSTPNGTTRGLLDRMLSVERNILPPDPCLYGTPLAGAPGYCVFNGQITQGITWSAVAGTFKVLQAYDETGPNGLVTAYPVDPCLRSDDANYNNQAYWEAAYADAVAAGDMAGGLTYGVDYPVTQSSAFFSECATVDTACVPMATIVADICRRAGLRTDTFDTDRRLGSDDLRTGLHHRAADVGARCARAAAHVRALGRR